MYIYPHSSYQRKEKSDKNYKQLVVTFGDFMDPSRFAPELLPDKWHEFMEAKLYFPD